MSREQLKSVIGRWYNEVSFDQIPLADYLATQGVSSAEQKQRSAEIKQLLHSFLGIA